MPRRAEEGDAGDEEFGDAEANKTKVSERPHFLERCDAGPEDRVDICLQKRLGAAGRGFSADAEEGLSRFVPQPTAAAVVVGVAVIVVERRVGRRLREEILNDEAVTARRQKASRRDRGGDADGERRIIIVIIRILSLERLGIGVPRPPVLGVIGQEAEDAGVAARHIKIIGAHWRFYNHL